MFAALAEFERELMRERTLAGIVAARARGRKGGRRPVLDSKQREAVLSLLKSRDLSVAEIGRQFGVSRSTIYNLLK
jgi:DNA invertase Pin-like site-specific DNA recombinase